MKKLLLFVALISAPILVFCQNKILINPSVGYAWRIAEKPVAETPDQKEYFKKISQGFNFDIGAYYLIKPDWGFGFKFNQFQSSAVNKFQGLNPDNTITNYSIDTTDKITFFGPGIYGGNFSSETKHKYITGIAIGLLHYRSSFSDIAFTGTTVGVAIDLGYQYQILPKISVGPQLGITGGTLSKFNFEGQTIDLPDDSKEGLTRISLGLGANIRF